MEENITSNLDTNIIKLRLLELAATYAGSADALVSGYERLLALFNFAK